MWAPGLVVVGPLVVLARRELELLAAFFLWPVVLEVFQGLAFVLVPFLLFAGAQVSALVLAEAQVLALAEVQVLVWEGGAEALAWAQVWVQVLPVAEESLSASQVVRPYPLLRHFESVNLEREKTRSLQS